jgi:alpha-1,2-mannosyltransferase
MSLSTRQRRPLLSDPSSSQSGESYTKHDKPERSDGGSSSTGEQGLGWLFPLFVLGTLRYMSATSNIIHDCDEVFNYWEPLHFLLYKSGFQTWEYRYYFYKPNCDQFSIFFWVIVLVCDTNFDFG